MSHNNPQDSDFLQQILGLHTLVGPDPSLSPPPSTSPYQLPPFPLGLTLQQSTAGFLNPADDHLIDSGLAPTRNVFNGQSLHSSVPVGTYQNPPAVRPRVRARRGQATDPHSIAERMRRERIAERVRALQELVPSVNKADRAAMLDEVVDYVKFLRLQVKVLSMSRLGGAGAVAPLMTDIPISSVEEEGGEVGRNQPPWDTWANDGTEQQVAKLMEENVGAAMQFLQAKQLCIMPVSLAAAIYPPQASDASTASTIVKPESNHP